MHLNGLKNAIARNEAVQVELHAAEQVLYIPFLRNGDSLQPLHANNTTLTFPSRSKALVALAQTGLRSVDFVHRSSYGEMIGTEGSIANTEFRQRVDLTRYRT